MQGSGVEICIQGLQIQIGNLAWCMRTVNQDQNGLVQSLEGLDEGLNGEKYRWSATYMVNNSDFDLATFFDFIHKKLKSLILITNNSHFLSYLNFWLFLYFLVKFATFLEFCAFQIFVRF